MRPVKQRANAALMMPAYLQEPAEVKKVISDFWKTMPERIRPNRYGVTAIKHLLDKDTIKLVATDGWRDETHFRGNGTEWSIYARSAFGFHSESEGSVAKKSIAELIIAMERFAMLWPVDFGCITSLSQSEYEVAKLNDTATNVCNRRRDEYTFIMVPRYLTMYIPDLYWQTYFGRPYIDMFGRDRLLSAPVFKSEELSDGLIRLQLTESLDDMHTNHDLIMKVREKVKQHLKKDAFFNPKKGEKHKYVVPRFV